MAGPLGRPLAYLTFGLNYYMAGGFDNTLIFKSTNLLIHIINSWLVWHFVSLLVMHLINTARLQNRIMIRVIPLLTAMLFAVHPIELTSVLYVVQRMTSLSAFFVLCGLSIFLRGRLMLPSCHVRAFLFMGAGLAIGLLGLASKENAILVIPLAAVIEYVVLTRDHLPTSIRNRLRFFYILTVGTPLFVAALWIFLDPSFLLKTYETRNFSLIERLFTEARILWYYLYLLIAPRLSTLSLFHDDIAISRTLFDPSTTFIAVAAIVSLIATAVRLRQRFPLFSFSVIWFFVSHALESGVFGLELAHEHRNYLPSIGFMLLLSLGISTIAARSSRTAMAVTMASGLIAIFGITTFARAANWSNEQRLIYHMVESHPRSPRAQFMYGEYLLKRAVDPRAAIKRFIHAAKLDPTEPAYLVALQRAASAISLVPPNHQPSVPDTASVGNAEDQDKSMPPDISLYFQKRLDRQKQIRFLLHPGISQQVAQLLHNEPVSDTSVSLLTELLDCVVDSPGQCSYFSPDVTSWALVAADNASLSPVKRHNLLVSLVNVRVSEKDYRGALRLILSGIAHEPRDATYRIMAADMLLFLDRCHEARGHLQHVLENEEGSMEDKSTVRMLLDKLGKYTLCHDRVDSVP